MVDSSLERHAARTAKQQNTKVAAPGVPDRARESSPGGRARSIRGQAA
jgi:hypothetical protein